jgi:hypothetical protein
MLGTILFVVEIEPRKPLNTRHTAYESALSVEQAARVGPPKFERRPATILSGRRINGVHSNMSGGAHRETALMRV